MTEKNRSTFEEALALPEVERAELADMLLQSLSPDMDELTDEEFYQELERRRKEAEKDPSALIPWADVVKDD